LIRIIIDNWALTAPLTNELFNLVFTLLIVKLQHVPKLALYYYFFLLFAGLIGLEDCIKYSSTEKKYFWFSLSVWNEICHQTRCFPSLQATASSFKAYNSFCLFCFLLKRELHKVETVCDNLPFPVYQKQ